MRRGYSEQLGTSGCVRHSRWHKRHIKRRLARARRRWEKVDPENVPQRLTRGWSD